MARWMSGEEDQPVHHRCTRLGSLSHKTGTQHCGTTEKDKVGGRGRKALHVNRRVIGRDERVIGEGDREAGRPSTSISV